MPRASSCSFGVVVQLYGSKCEFFKVEEFFSKAFLVCQSVGGLGGLFLLVFFFKCPI